MKNELKILRNLVYSEYANNKNVSFNDVKIEEVFGKLRFIYFKPKLKSLSIVGQETKEICCNVDHVLELVVDRMYNSFDETPYNPNAKLIVDKIYNSIYSLYNSYIVSENYYI